MAGPEYTVSRKKLSSEDIDPFTGRKWGKKQTLIERTIDEGGHPIINKEMFTNYAKARIAAALDIYEKEHLGEISDNADELDFLQRNIQNFFEDDDFEQMNFMRTKLKMMRETGQNPLKVEKQLNHAFDSVYEKNIEKLKQLNAMLAHLVDPESNAEKVVKAINERASELRALEKRPIQQNQYSVDGISVTSTHTPEGWLTPEQEKLYEQKHGKPPPQGPYTSPSTIRDSRQIGQANAVRAEIKAGSTTFIGHRHGSPSVLKIKSEADRQHRTLQNVKQSMTLAAQNKFTQLTEEQQKQISENGFLTIDMASMSLLSPIMKGDKFDPMKQYRQVEDTRHAYWSLNGRVIPLSVVDNQGNQIPIKVQLNSTFMSIGVNAARGVGTPDAKQLVQRINNRGINHFTDNFLRNMDPNDNLPVKVIVENIKHAEKNPDIEKYQLQLAEFNRASAPLLQQAYETLEAYNKVLSEGYVEGIEDTKKIKSERKELLKTIDKEERKLDKIYEGLANARQKVYSEKIQSWRGALDDIQKIQPGNKDFQKTRLFVDALDIYYNQPQPGLKRFLAVRSKSNQKKKLLKQIDKIQEKMQSSDETQKSLLREKIGSLKEKADNLQKEVDILNNANYRFQARFAVLSENMGGFVEWMCKSGEDRTGLLNEHIEAFCIFIEKNGLPPRWENEQDRQSFDEIMHHVHNGAPNRETCACNDDSYGMKVTDKDFRSSVSYERDKKMANTLKNSSDLFGYSLKDKILHAFRIPRKEILRQEEQSKLAELREPINTFLKKIDPAYTQSSPVYTPSLDEKAKSERKQVERKWEPSVTPQVRKKGPVA